MQTLAFLWYELKAAKRNVKEAVAECQQCGKVDFSFLNRPAEASVIDEGTGPTALHDRSLRLTAVAAIESGIYFQGCAPTSLSSCLSTPLDQLGSKSCTGDR